MSSLASCFDKVGFLESTSVVEYLTFMIVNHLKSICGIEYVTFMILNHLKSILTQNYSLKFESFVEPLGVEPSALSSLITFEW